MPFTRKRTSKAGSISTTLVESYRNEAGRPRIRILANLHGERDTLSALAKLAALRANLREEKETLDEELVSANQFYEVITANTLHGHQYDAAERQAINKLMAARELSAETREASRCCPHRNPARRGRDQETLLGNARRDPGRDSVVQGTPARGGSHGLGIRICWRATQGSQSHLATPVPVAQSRRGLAV